MRAQLLARQPRSPGALRLDEQEHPVDLCRKSVDLLAESAALVTEQLRDVPEIADLG